MFFDFRSFFRFMYLVYFRSRDVNFPLTPKRALGFGIYFLLFPIFELFTAACLLLDHVFFPGFRRISIDKPLFIVGHPRSGTTYLQGLIAKDDELFFSFRVWETIFPSILQKKVLAWIGRFDQQHGGRLKAMILRRQERLLGHYDDIHDMGLFELAEDDRLLMHTVCVPIGQLLLMNATQLDWIFYFDEQAREKDRIRVMKFFRACIQRQSYYKGGNRILLTKAPLAGLRVKSLYRFFPGCRMIYTLRNPLAAVPSILDLGRRHFEANADMENWPAQQTRLYPFLREMFRYPLASLQQADPATCEIIIHDHLLRRPGDVVRACYKKFGYSLSPRYDELLKHEGEKQRNFTSRHKTTLNEFNLTPEQIRSDFKDVFDRCAFET